MRDCSRIRSIGGIWMRAAAPMCADRVLRQQQGIGRCASRVVIHQAQHDLAQCSPRRRARRHFPRPRGQHRARGRRIERWCNRPAGAVDGVLRSRTRAQPSSRVTDCGPSPCHTRASLQCVEPHDRGVPPRAAVADSADQLEIAALLAQERAAYRRLVYEQARSTSISGGPRH